MITETLSNSLKSLFASLGAKTTDNNYAVGLYNKTNGEPLGLMDMANLASVLGAIKASSSLRSSANTIKETSAYFVYGDSTRDTPDDYGVLLTIISYSNTEYGPSLAQLFISYHQTLYFRTSMGGTYNTWTQVSTI